MPSATIAHAAVAVMPTMNATGVRPDGRPASVAAGSNGSPAADGPAEGCMDSGMPGSILSASHGRTWALT
jgi:hypothetical protein